MDCEYSKRHNNWVSSFDNTNGRTDPLLASKFTVASEEELGSWSRDASSLEQLVWTVEVARNGAKHKVTN